MIGVVANAEGLETAREFFELFKTPWEPALPARKYAVIVSVDESIEHLDADFFILYSSRPQPTDRDTGTVMEQFAGPADVAWAETTFPLYSRLALFNVDDGIVKCRGRSLDFRFELVGRRGRRVGYDLFSEIAHLLTDGQPASWAATPTLDWHIELLKQFLLDAGTSFLEIPPRPVELDFVCCLTHDVDFFGIRRHSGDRTFMGFLARASVGTFVDLLRARRTLGEAIRNWAAFLSLPFVFLRLLPDFWRPFVDYAAVEKRHRSTFFLIPFKARPGRGIDGSERMTRAAPYQVSEIGEQVRDVAARGNEVAVHGIDAWCDADAGRAERAELASVSGDAVSGVRMHWLYFDRDSPERLEEAGFAYDSTWGYNDAVGYRAGTSQVFRPPRSQQLLELPLSIMDSAMFYRGRMGLTFRQALPVCRAIVAHARRFGGTVVINWHDRSLSPERLWNRCYVELLAECERGDRAWFATAGDAVEWFRWRRSIRFSTETPGKVRISATAPRSGMPAARVSVRRGTSGAERSLEEMQFAGGEALEIPL